LAWLHFKTLNLSKGPLYLRDEGHEMKLKFMTPTQASKDQHRLKEKIEKERIEKEDVLTGPEIVIHESLKGFGRLISAVLLLLQGNSRGGAGDLQKTLQCLSQHR